MHKTLADAPIGKTLILSAINSESLTQKLNRLGVFEGTRFRRMDREVVLQTVRVRGSNGEFILGGGMSTKIIVHLDDGRKLPLAEMKAGDKGHIEGLTGGTSLGQALLTLGFDLDDTIEFVRRIPPMIYTAQVEEKGLVRLSEGIAAKIWGKIQGADGDQPIQFCSTQVRKPFEVQQLLGGEKSRRSIREFGIDVGSVLMLTGVEQASTMYSGKSHPVIVSVPTGLRFFLSTQDSRQIYVRQVD